MATTQQGSGPADYIPAATPPGGMAGWWSRVGATILDGLIIFVPLLLGGIALIVSDTLAGLFAFVYLLAVFFYAPVMLTAHEGRTWGKQAAGIRVVRMDGSEVGFGQAVGREWLKLLFGITGILWIIDVLWPVQQPENRAWHDLITGTRVITVAGTPPVPGRPAVGEAGTGAWAEHGEQSGV
jgi:uncharacterized RDD family membrane protein YckC